MFVKEPYFVYHLIVVVVPKHHSSLTLKFNSRPESDATAFAFSAPIPRFTSLEFYLFFAPTSRTKSVSETFAQLKLSSLLLSTSPFSLQLAETFSFSCRHQVLHEALMSQLVWGPSKPHSNSRFFSSSCSKVLAKASSSYI